METLEEAAEKFYPSYPDGIITDEIRALREGFVKGYEVQAERMYSEEEVIELLEYTRENFYDTGTKWHEEPYKDLTSKELLEQFKKK